MAASRRDHPLRIRIKDHRPSATSVPPELAGKYAKTIAELQAALQDCQPPVPVASAARGQRSNRNGVALKCQCTPAQDHPRG